MIITPHVFGVNLDLKIPKDALEHAGKIKVQEGYEVKLWAAEPLVQDPVAIYIDEKGRVFSAETARQTNGVEDNRGHGYWLMDDLAAETVDDRLEMFRKWQDKFEGGMDYFRRADEWVRLIQDTDGDGVADTATKFAENFNDPLDGTGAGVLSWDGDVYYTNIPHLWKLTDIDNDGVAESRQSMFSGFGVRIALRGHDMHGLVIGPDGKLYWSIGDRGYHVTTQEGNLLHDAGSGAVFRCNFDGSELEVFHTSLRNPQELAFDKYGNLFTGDNNSDAGDRARIVYCVEGGESGWNMAYQYLGGDYSRGPWNNEKLWHTQHEGQAAWVLPPIEHIGNGPSGFTYFPGTGLPPQYNGHFFMCDFRGGAAQSLVHAFAVNPDGAGFKVENRHDFLNNVLVTDFDFGFDGKMYLSDWVASWNHNGKGRIYTVEFKNLPANPEILKMKNLVAEGFGHRSNQELATLLSHEDMRVRLRAQLALAEKGPEALTTFESALNSGPQIQKIHAIWGLGILARDFQKNRQGYERHPLSRVIRMANQKDPEVRAQVAKVFGDNKFVRGTKRIAARLLTDESPRVKFFAAMAVGKCGLKEHAADLVNILSENKDEDVYLRHACVMGLSWLGDADLLVKLGSHEESSVRTGALLALRKMKHGKGISFFLSDSDESVVTEAARAINDLNLGYQLSSLAGLAVAYQNNSVPNGFAGDNEALLRRVINANFRLGHFNNAERVIELVKNGKLSKRVRAEAIRSLGDWIEPGKLDRVLGWYRPVSRDAASEQDKIMALLENELPALANTLSRDLSEEAGKAMAKLGITLSEDRILAVISDASKPVSQRVSAVSSLASLDSDLLAKGVNAALDSNQPDIIGAGMELLVKTQGPQAFRKLRILSQSDNAAIKNAAIVQIGHIDSKESSDFFLNNVVKQLSNGSIDPAIHLEIITLAQAKEDPAFKEAIQVYVNSFKVANELKEWMPTRFGGDVANGKSLFESHPIAQCLRCHKVGNVGVGEAGPDLKGIASRMNTDKLLESLIIPNAELAEGFGPVSAMPPMGYLLKKEEIRDIMAYIITLK